jgi:hypothetical protein
MAEGRSSASPTACQHIDSLSPDCFFFSFDGCAQSVYCLLAEILVFIMASLVECGIDSVIFFPAFSLLSITMVMAE